MKTIGLIAGAFARPLLLAACLAPSLAGCGTNATTGKPNTFSDNLQSVADWNKTYLPIIGKNLLLVGEILVQVECAPITPTLDQAAGNVLNVVVKDSAVIETVQNTLNANTAIVGQLCPLYPAITTPSGNVPPPPVGATPQQIPVAAATPAASSS